MAKSRSEQFVKLQLINDKINQNTNFTKLPSAKMPKCLVLYNFALFLIIFCQFLFSLKILEKNKKNKIPTHSCKRKVEKKRKEKWKIVLQEGWMDYTL